MNIPLPTVLKPAVLTPSAAQRSRTASPTRRRPRRRLASVAMALCALLTPLAVQAAAAPAAEASTHVERFWASSVLSVLNVERRLHGLPALRSNDDLILSARRHNLTMARYNTMSHQLPSEAFFANRISAAGYQWMWAGENIGWNSQMTLPGVVVLEQMMYNERPPNDGHRRNILSTHYRDVGVDVYFDYTHHKVWLTTDFGSHS